MRTVRLQMAAEALGASAWGGRGRGPDRQANTAQAQADGATEATSRPTAPSSQEACPCAALHGQSVRLPCSQCGPETSSPCNAGLTGQDLHLHETPAGSWVARPRVGPSICVSVRAPSVTALCSQSTSGTDAHSWGRGRRLRRPSCPLKELPRHAGTALTSSSLTLRSQFQAFFPTGLHWVKAELLITVTS